MKFFKPEDFESDFLNTVMSDGVSHEIAKIANAKLEREVVPIDSHQICEKCQNIGVENVKIDWEKVWNEVVSTSSPDM
jgi:hypothetical protein